MKSNLKLTFNESGRSLQLIIEDGKEQRGIRQRTVDGDTYLNSECISFYEQLLKLFKEFDSSIEADQMRKIKGKKIGNIIT